MNPINYWPLTGEHPSWCGGWFCSQTKLGHEHRSDPTHLTVDGDRWEFTLHRADEPGPGETQICVVATSGAFCQAPIQHMISLKGADQLADQLRDMVTTARAEESAPALEVVR